MEEALWFQELQGISALVCVPVSLRQGAAVGLGLGKVDKPQISHSGGSNLQLWPAGFFQRGGFALLFGKIPHGCLSDFLLLEGS